MTHEYIYSRNAVYEALRAGGRQIHGIQIAEGVQETGRLAEIINTANQHKIKIERVAKSRLDKVNPGHQGVIAEAEAYRYVDLLDILDQARSKSEEPFILLLDALQDPQNFGTLLRTAEAVGVHGIVIPLAQAVGVTPAVVNASSGATEYLQIARSNLSHAIDVLKNENIWIVGLDQDGIPLGEDSERHLQGAIGLVVGSEGWGLRQLIRSKCDVLLQLPMHGRIESLNAAIAGSVALFLVSLKFRS